MSVVYDSLAAGDSIEDIARDYAITPDDVRACVAFPRVEIDRESFVPISARQRAVLSVAWRGRAGRLPCRLPREQ